MGYVYLKCCCTIINLKIERTSHNLCSQTDHINIGIVWWVNNYDVRHLLLSALHTNTFKTCGPANLSVVGSQTKAVTMEITEVIQTFIVLQYLPKLNVLRKLLILLRWVGWGWSSPVEVKRDEACRWILCSCILRGSVHISGIVRVCVCVCLHILHCLHRWSHCDPACHGQWGRTFQVEEHVTLWPGHHLEWLDVFHDRSS